MYFILLYSSVWLLASLMLSKWIFTFQHTKVNSVSSMAFRTNSRTFVDKSTTQSKVSALKEKLSYDSYEHCIYVCGVYRHIYAIYYSRHTNFHTLCLDENQTHQHRTTNQHAFMDCTAEQWESFYVASTSRIQTAQQQPCQCQQQQQQRGTRATTMRAGKLVGFGRGGTASGG